jgi:hypothetical protein
MIGPKPRNIAQALWKRLSECIEDTHVTFSHADQTVEHTPLLKRNHVGDDDGRGGGDPSTSEALDDYFHRVQSITRSVFRQVKAYLDQQ